MRVLALIYFCIVPIYFYQIPSAIAGLFGPSNYDECVLDSMKGVRSNVAAGAIIAACRRKFPIQELSGENIALPAEAVRKLNIIIHGNRSTHWASGNIYNGNEHWVVTQVTIKYSGRNYNISEIIPPLTQKDFGFQYTETARKTPGKISSLSQLEKIAESFESQGSPLKAVGYKK